jgi:hypothetical protein
VGFDVGGTLWLRVIIAMQIEPEGGRPEDGDSGIQENAGGCAPQTLAEIPKLRAAELFLP